VHTRGNNIGAGERLCRNSDGIVETRTTVALQATRPEPQPARSLDDRQAG
jgi:hypothetical protein